jgi:WD40 repeat protein
MPRLLSTVTNPRVTTGSAKPLGGRLGKTLPTKGVAIDREEQLLALASDTAVSLWNISNPGRPVRLKTLAGTAIPDSVAFSPDGHLLAVANRWSSAQTGIASRPGPLPVRTSSR